MKIDMPYGAKQIIKELNRHGYEAYIVGGCVRDSLLGKLPSDWDITTAATPEEIKSIFKRTVDTGIQHGTVTVLIYPPEGCKQVGAAREDGLEAYEVTTYRVDGVYEDHRRPKNVTFTARLEEDLKRRDFTINAMAYSAKTGVVDIFGGINDLENGIIRCVGNPDDRFDEDALRILRAVRFSAQLGFDIDGATEKSIRTHAMYLKDISAERIQVELTKLITSVNPSRLIKAYELGLTKIILPEFDAMMNTEQNNPYHLYNVGMHTIKVMEHIPPTTVLRYAALLHDSGKPECKTTDEKNIDHFNGHQEKSEEISKRVLHRLKMDNNTIKTVSLLARFHDYGMGEIPSPKAFRRFLAKLGKENFDMFMLIKKADMAGQSDYRIAQRERMLEELQKLYDEVVEQEQGLYISDLAIGGQDIIDMGIQQGRQIGQILHRLMEEVLDNPENNNREYLLERVRELI